MGRIQVNVRFDQTVWKDIEERYEEIPQPKSRIVLDMMDELQDLAIKADLLQLQFEEETGNMIPSSWPQMQMVAPKKKPVVHAVTLPLDRYSLITQLNRGSDQQLGPVINKLMWQHHDFRWRIKWLENEIGQFREEQDQAPGEVSSE